MHKFPFIHISFSLAEEEERIAWDQFVKEVFSPRLMYEVLSSPEATKLGLDRHQTLFAIGNTVIYAAAPAGNGLRSDSTIGNMLRSRAKPNAWVGIAIGVSDLDVAREWVCERGWSPTSYPLLEDRYFLVDRNEILGMRLEFLTGDLANDPRLAAGWDPYWWRDEHPLGLEGLQSIGVSTKSLDAARTIFSHKLGWREISSRVTDEARCASFLIGDAIVEAMEPIDPNSELGVHASAANGIWCLNFQVRSAREAADYLESKGLRLLGERHRHFLIDPKQAFGRQLRFTEERVSGYPDIPIPSLVTTPAELE